MKKKSRYLLLAVIFAAGIAAVIYAVHIDRQRKETKQRRQDGETEQVTFPVESDQGFEANTEVKADSAAGDTSSPQGTADESSISSYEAMQSTEHQDSAADSAGNQDAEKKPAEESSKAAQKNGGRDDNELEEVPLF